MTRTSYIDFCCTDAATADIYTLFLHDALPISLLADPRLANDSQFRRVALTSLRKVIEDADVPPAKLGRSEEHTSELQSRRDLVCRLLLEKKNTQAVNRYRLQVSLRDIYRAHPH